MTNEAAERLRTSFNVGRGMKDFSILSDKRLRLLDAALAAERRATVERIRERISLLADQQREHVTGYAAGVADSLAILDEVAAHHQGEQQAWDAEQFAKHEQGEHVFNFTDDCYVCRYVRNYQRGL